MRPLFLYCIVLLIGAACTSRPLATLEIKIEDENRQFSLIRLQEDLGLRNDQDYHLVAISNGRMIPLVREDDELVFMLGDLEKGIHYFEIREGKMDTKVKASVEQEDGGYQFRVNDKPVLFYQKETVLPAEVSNDYYQRSGYIHPLQSPGGQVLTDDFPKGHTHQHAIFNAWVNTLYKGEKVDFWNQHQETGTVAHVDIIEVKDGNGIAKLGSKLSHISLKHGEVLSETWKITVYPLEEHFLFDLEFEQVNTSEDTLHILEYHYGGLGFRGSREWNDVDTANFTNTWKIKTSEGHDNATANHTSAKWVTAHGEVQGVEAGLTVFSSPENFRHPQKIRVHPTMPYWVYAPMVDGEFHIPPGGTYKGHYRYLVHQGSGDSDLIQAISNDLESPLDVEIKR